MDRRTSPLGPFVALAGASLVLASLWLPWYELRIPDAIREAFRSFGSSGVAPGATAGQDTGFGKFFEGLAAVIPDAATVSGWQGMEQGDVALAVIASLVLLIATAAGGILGPSVRADAGLAGRLMALMGAASLAVVGYHVITRPGADFPGAGDYVELRLGIWIAVLGSALIVAGGLIAASAQQRTADDAWSAAGGSAGELPAADAFAAVPRAVAPDAAPSGGFGPTPAYTAAPATSIAPPGFTPSV